MSSKASFEAEQAVKASRYLAEQYYDIALPAMQERLASINQALGLGGEPGYLREAYAAQRTGLAEGVVGKEKSALTSQLAGTKQAREGGNVLSGLSPSDIGAQLANALYGSKFQESMAGIDQTMNLMSMALGGAGTAGSGALEASANQMRAIGYMPNYNPTLAGVSGGLSAAAGLYGAYQNQQVANTMGQLGPAAIASLASTGYAVPTPTNYPSTVVGGGG